MSILYRWFLRRWFGAYSHISKAIGFTFTAIPLSLCFNFTVHADFIDKMRVVENDGIYFIDISAELNADAEHIKRILTDYEHIYRLSDSVLASEVFTSTDDGSVQVQSQVLCCTPLFCRTVERMDNVSELDSNTIKAEIVPAYSDFRSGTAIWKITSLENKTRLTYQASIEPDFFIPPILGTRMVVANMRNEFRTTFYRIERFARINEAREWDDDFGMVGEVAEREETPCNEEFITGLY